MNLEDKIVDVLSRSPGRSLEELRASIGARSTLSIGIAIRNLMDREEVAAEGNMLDSSSLTFRLRAPPTPAPATMDPKGAAGALKAPLWLIPPAAEEEMAKALALGVEKYGAWNWRKAKVCRSTYISAMKRHIGRILDGEEFDKEGQHAHHLGHVMACCAIILDAQRHGTLVIDGEEKA